jgi:hypothetical protein
MLHLPAGLDVAGAPCLRGEESRENSYHALPAMTWTIVLTHADNGDASRGRSRESASHMFR